MKCLWHTDSIIKTLHFRSARGHHVHDFHFLNQKNVFFKKILLLVFSITDCEKNGETLQSRCEKFSNFVMVQTKVLNRSGPVQIHLLGCKIKGQRYWRWKQVKTEWAVIKKAKNLEKKVLLKKVNKKKKQISIKKKNVLSFCYWFMPNYKIFMSFLMMNWVIQPGY